MLTPLNQQLSGNQPPPSMQPLPVPPGTAPQSPMHPVAPSTLGALPPTPPQATRPSIGNPATPFADPTKNTPSLGIGQQLAAQGRGPDSALVHMAPRELQGLNALAQSATGQTLPINPKTGLPEAGILSSLLPMLIGAVLTPLTGGIINPLTAGLLVGGGYGLATHSLTKGLMAGLSAYGGAGIGSAVGGLMGLGSSAAGAAGAGASAVPMATQTIGAAANPLALAGASAAPLAGSAAAPLVSGAVPSMASMLAGGASAAVPMATQTAAALAPSLATSAAPAAADLISAGAPAVTAPASLSGLGSSFASALRAPGAGAIPGTGITAPGLPGMIPRSISTAAGVTGITSALGGAMTPEAPKLPADATGKFNYAGPYLPTPRKVMTPPKDRSPTDSSEFQWFEDVNPFPAYTTASGGPPPGYPGYVPPTPEQLKQRKDTLGYASGGSTDTPAPKAKKNFFENSLPLGLIGALSGVGGPSAAQGQDQGHSPFGNLGALAALGGLGGMGLMQALGYGNPLASLMRTPTPPPEDIDPETGLPRRKPLVPAGMARGGVVSLKPGGFVMDARSVSEVGNGSSNAGKEILKKHGGKPIDGGGDGVSDAIPAKIKGGPKARVARDEVHFPPEAVARIGRGNRRRGAQKLYGIMARAHAARAQAGRGADTGLRRGLA